MGIVRSSFLIGKTANRTRLALVRAKGHATGSPKTHLAEITAAQLLNMSHRGLWTLQPSPFLDANVANRRECDHHQGRRVSLDCPAAFDFAILGIPAADARPPVPLRRPRRSNWPVSNSLLGANHRHRVAESAASPNAAWRPSASCHSRNPVWKASGRLLSTLSFDPARADRVHGMPRLASAPRKLAPQHFHGCFAAPIYPGLPASQIARQRKGDGHDPSALRLIAPPPPHCHQECLRCESTRGPIYPA